MATGICDGAVRAGDDGAHIGILPELLEGMVADETQPVDRLPLLRGRAALWWRWNATEADYPRDSCVHELFEAQVARTPEAVAVVHGEQSLTYAELNARANRAGASSANVGGEPDTGAAICVERSLEMVVGLLAVLKAGGAYVPLDPAYPVERLRYMLEDSAPIVLLTQGDLAEGLAEVLPKNLSVIDLRGRFRDSTG